MTQEPKLSLKYLVETCKNWEIESMNWILGVTLREDDSRIRKGQVPENMANSIYCFKYALKNSMLGKRQRATLSVTFRGDVLDKF